MTTFKVTDQNHPLHGREFEEYTQFARYNGGVEWIPLLIGPNTVKFFALCNLREVRQPNMTDLDYCYPQPCRAIVLWKPLVVYITADMIGNARAGIPGIDISKSSGVVFKDAEAA